MKNLNPSSEYIRVLIADPHPIVREGVAAVLAQQPDMQCTGRTQNGQETLSLLGALKPDVVVMEMDFPDVDGKRLIADIQTQLPSVSILVLTSQAGDEAIYQALHTGAKGYLLKDVSIETIANAIRTIRAGENAIAPNVAALLAFRLRVSKLTPREREILLHLTQGQNNQEIAKALSITDGTVKAHVNKVLVKLKVKDRTQAAIMGIKRGFVPKP